MGFSLLQWELGRPGSPGCAQQHFLQSAVCFWWLEPCLQQSADQSSHFTLQAEGQHLAFGFCLRRQSSVFQQQIIVMQVERGLSHLGTAHSLFGAATLLMTVASALGGALSFGKVGLLQFVPEQHHARIKGAHRQVCDHLSLLMSNFVAACLACSSSAFLLWR